MKTLILDIETAPNVAYVWRFFKENIGAKQVKENSYIMSFAAKWLGEDDITYVENRHGDEGPLLGILYSMLDDADFVVAHNGARFDLPKIKGRGLVSGLTPPAPYKIIDTCQIARREFGFESNSLEYLCDILDLPKKLAHKKFPGFSLWLQCLKQNDEAWDEMREYNIHDVVCLEALYEKIKGYDSRHPNVAVLDDRTDISCPKCGSSNSHRRGFYFTNVGKYQRYRCNSCGGWHRSRYTENDIEVRKALTTNAV